jgi:hypothetical protein
MKQDQRKHHPEILLKIKLEVDKLLAAGFFREIKYPA